jgi:hypothetical protein
VWQKFNDVPGNLLPPSTLMMEVAVNFYHAPQHHIPEDSNVQCHYCENLKFHITILKFSNPGEMHLQELNNVSNSPPQKNFTVFIAKDKKNEIVCTRNCKRCVALIEKFNAAE